MREKVREQVLHWYFLTSEWVCRWARRLERSAKARLQWEQEKGFSPGERKQEAIRRLLSCLGRQLTFTEIPAPPPPGFRALLTPVTQEPRDPEKPGRAQCPKAWFSIGSSGQSKYFTLLPQSALCLSLEVVTPRHRDIKQGCPGGAKLPPGALIFTTTEAASPLRRL